MLTILTIQDIIKLCPNLVNAVLKLVETGKVKNDGALDSIPNISKKNVISTEKLRFILEVQRVDSIEEANILRNLEEIGGFSHSSSGVIDVFGYEDDTKDYVTSPDGMHRALMAYLCEVMELAVNEQDVHSLTATDEEVINKEKKFFDDKNVRSAKVSTASQMRSDKLSGKMTPDQEKLDKKLADAYVHINTYGCAPETALFTLDSFAEVPKVFLNEKSTFYAGDNINETVTYMSKFLTRDSLSPKQFCAISYIFSKPFGEDEEKRVLFKLFMTSNSKYSFGAYDENFWTDKVQHSRGMESAVIRLLVAFNQWHKFCFETNAVDMSYFDDILKLMNVETRHFVEDCINQGICIKKASILHEETEQEQEMQTVSDSL